MNGFQLEFLRSVTLLFMLLNPFLVILYLIDLVQKLTARRFAIVLFHGAMISSAVFIAFSVLGDVIFTDIMHAEFASFQIFGGIVFLIVGIQFVLRGTAAMDMLRGESQELAGAIAMPVMIGPGTVSAVVVIGKHLDTLPAMGAIISAVMLSVVVMIGLKKLHDRVLPRNEKIVRRYVQVAGRIMAIYVGTISVQMIMQGIKSWACKF